MRKTLIAMALMSSTAYAQQSGPPYYGPVYQTVQAAPDRAKDCSDANVGELCFKTRPLACEQPVGASNVHTDPQEIAHICGAEVKGQNGLRSEISKRVWIDACIKQLSVPGYRGGF